MSWNYEALNKSEWLSFSESTDAAQRRERIHISLSSSHGHQTAEHHSTQKNCTWAPRHQLDTERLFREKSFHKRCFGFFFLFASVPGRGSTLVTITKLGASLSQSWSNCAYQTHTSHSTQWLVSKGGENRDLWVDQGSPPTSTLRWIFYKSWFPDFTQERRLSVQLIWMPI